MAVKEASEWISSFAGQIAISSAMICGELTCGEWRGRDKHRQHEFDSYSLSWSPAPQG